VIPSQDVAQVSTNWPAGNIDLRMANYLCQAQQKWSITAVTNAGGYPGSPYFKITIAGTDRALAATADGELVALPAFTGAPEQLWRIDQLTDGTWRIVPRRSRSRYPPSAAVSRRSPSSMRRATSNAGGSRRHDATSRNHDFT
jgi:arabinan endo-1,5-alpha-L-arabinosidase